MYFQTFFDGYFIIGWKSELYLVKAPPPES